MPAAGDGAAAPADAAAGDVKEKNGKAAGKAKKAGGAGAGKAARAGKKRKKGSGGRGKGKGKKGAKGAKGGKGGKGAKGGKGGKKRKRGAGKAKRRKALTAAQAAKYLLYFQVKAREKSINFYTKWWKEFRAQVTGGQGPSSKAADNEGQNVCKDPDNFGGHRGHVRENAQDLRGAG
ncbi:MAG: hypothetical protein BJ554DRAFT_5081 [Olpidium bornovanus]|uniref:Uncharacterized protein n=1 Tax=Olpidium bornovanus TaxID=278681 RepID=A0A8H7ZZR3_9FUNG|nr:MAG: hypothetical protein BJ554DRAFT_5081 [Olpidium bornovanus]